MPKPKRPRHAAAKPSSEEMLQAHISEPQPAEDRPEAGPETAPSVGKFKRAGLFAARHSGLSFMAKRVAKDVGEPLADARASFFEMRRFLAESWRKARNQSADREPRIIDVPNELDRKLWLRNARLTAALYLQLFMAGCGILGGGLLGAHRSSFFMVTTAISGLMLAFMGLVKYAEAANDANALMVWRSEPLWTFLRKPSRWLPFSEAELKDGNVVFRIAGVMLLGLIIFAGSLWAAS